MLVYLNVYNTPLIKHGKIYKHCLLKVLETIKNDSLTPLITNEDIPIIFENAKIKNKKLTLTKNYNMFINISLDYIQVNNINLDMINFIFFDYIKIAQMELLAYLIKMKKKIEFLNHDNVVMPFFERCFHHLDYRANLRNVLQYNMAYVYNDDDDDDTVAYQLKSIINNCIEYPKAFKWTTLITTDKLLYYIKYLFNQTTIAKYLMENSADLNANYLLFFNLIQDLHINDNFLLDKPKIISNTSPLVITHHSKFFSAINMNYNENNFYSSKYSILL